MAQRPYGFLLGHGKRSTLGEVHLGDGAYARRLRVDGRAVVFTFSLNRRSGLWGVDCILQRAGTLADAARRALRWLTLRGAGGARGGAPALRSCGEAPRGLPTGPA
ncbi:unnamed protein product, partial [Prorocentrum cordatum]